MLQMQCRNEKVWQHESQSITLQICAEIFTQELFHYSCSPEEEGERSLVLVSRQLDLSGKWLSLPIINCVVLIEERNEEIMTQRERTPPAGVRRCVPPPQLPIRLLAIAHVVSEAGRCFPHPPLPMVWNFALFFFLF